MVRAVGGKAVHNGNVFDRYLRMSQAAQTLPADAEAGAAPAKSGKLGLILGLVGALALGGGGFYAVYSGILDPAALMSGGQEAAGGHGEAAGKGPATAGPGALTDVAFVKLDPIMVSLPPGSGAKLLRFSGQLEVAPEHVGEVTTLLPRVIDTLNTYLRAVDVADLAAPAMAVKIRAQMLRRVQIVTGEGRVRDLLISEFVLN